MRYGIRYGCIAVAAAAALLLFNGGADAQVTVEDERQSSFEIRAGAAIPGSDLADRFDPGFSAGLGVGFPMAERFRLTLEGDAGFLSDVVRDQELGTGEVRQFFEGDLRLWHYGVGLEGDVVDPERSDASVVLQGGVGATTIDPERIRIVTGGEDPVLQEPETRTRFTANGGLAVGFGVSEGVDLLLDGRAYAIFLEEQDFELEETLEDTVGDVWWSFPLQVAFRFRAP